MRFLSEAELQAIWNTLSTKIRQGQRDRTIFLLLLDSGVRATELLGIKLEDANLSSGTIQITGEG